MNPSLSSLENQADDRYFFNVLVSPAPSSRTCSWRVGGATPAARGTFGHQRIGRAMCRPRNATKQHRLYLRIGEVRIEVTLHPYKGAIGLSCRRRRELLFVGPHLRHYFAG